MSYLINFVLFQVAWFAGILGASNQMSHLGVAIILLCLGIHFWRLPKQQIKNEASLVARCLVLGFVIDSVLIQTQLMTYASAGLIEGVSPVWMCLLWAALAITLNHSLAWLKKSYWLAAILGGITGPLSYLAGVKLCRNHAQSINHTTSTRIDLGNRDATDGEVVKQVFKLDFKNLIRRSLDLRE